MIGRFNIHLTRQLDNHVVCIHESILDPSSRHQQKGHHARTSVLPRPRGHSEAVYATSTINDELIKYNTYTSLQGEDGFLITTPGACLTDVSWGLSSRRLSDFINLSSGANRRYLSQVERDVGKASCGQSPAEPRKTAQTPATPADSHFERIGIGIGIGTRIRGDIKTAQQPKRCCLEASV